MCVVSVSMLGERELTVELDIYMSQDSLQVPGAMSGVPDRQLGVG